MCQKNNSQESIQLFVQGRVQGVGFRPFVYRLAKSLALSGFVKNTHDGVQIVLSGSSLALDAFEKRLRTDAPRSSRIASIERSSPKARMTIQDFQILESDSEEKKAESTPIEVSPDLAICSSCVNELFSPSNRRYLHPFITCTQCGPRYSIISNLPYDRPHTSMSNFPMCPSCTKEYQSPGDLRFHSQTNACHDCGPKLSLFSHEGQIEESNAIELCAKHILNGDIIALKGIGGFHLICDTNKPESIQKLRKLKARPDKPFAIMALNIASLEDLVKLDKNSIAQLESDIAPIVLIPKQTQKEELIAPGLSDLGCMLPYTALHFLLFHALLGKPEGTKWLSNKSDMRLIVTSANLPGEPIVYDNQACLAQLPKLADYALLFDRDIIAPSEDSVIQSAVLKGLPSTIIRRSRGYAPASIPLNNHDQNILACGAHLKNTFCLSQNGSAYLSPYIGELDSPARLKRFKSTLAHYQHLFGKQIDSYSADRHPDYVSTLFAEEHSHSNNLPLARIQHHHAHLASVMAEQSPPPEETFLGLILDGNGLGNDNQAWGGELFFGNSHRFERIGQLEEIAIPGGDIAVREIWRIGASLLNRINPDQAQRMYADELKSELTQNFIFKGNHPQTSSAGRWFDAIASLIRLRQICSYEGQAAAELEASATTLWQTSVSVTKDSHLSPTPELRISPKNQLMLSPIVPHLLDCDSQEQAARIFHSALIDGLTRWLEKAAQDHKTQIIYCSGGCFQNRLLREGLYQGLSSCGFTLYFNKKVPANDGGISLGQAYLSKL